MKGLYKYLLLFFMLSSVLSAQEDNPFISYDVPAQNLLKFNRFLINPTFSTVREDKSYMNLLHRNQSVSFDDNNQTYFLSYSGRINDRTGLGLSLYTQREGLISNYGVLANYAYGIKLSAQSNFTFGGNFSYYNSGFDASRANPVEEDPVLNGFQDNSMLSFQPGFNISYNQWDFGLFAENLFDYNLKTSESVTAFEDKTFSGHLQYTYPLENTGGIFESGRLMPLARVRKVGANDVVLGGNLIMDLPKLGWIQGGYDSFYGASAGIGFNLSQRLSLGYTMEKGLSSNFDNFGLTHEISFAYSFIPTLTEDRVMLEEETEALAEAVEDEEQDSTAIITDSRDKEIAELQRRLAENDTILAELMFQQDSLEANRQQDLERRFEMVMRMVRAETNGDRPDLEERARSLYYGEDAGLKPTPLFEGPEGGTLLVSNTAASSEAFPEKSADATETAAFAKAAREHKVRNMSFRNLQGVPEGYYLVANVYKDPHYLNKFIGTLQSAGIEAEYIDNLQNGLKYVYLQRYDSWQEALAAHRSQYNGSYKEDLWIMNVNNRYSNDAFTANSRKISEKAEEYETDVLRKNVVVQDRIATQGDSTALTRGGAAYYIIANVFASQNNANRFVKLLNAQGLSAAYFINPENNYRYVYLKRHESWNSALISYYSRLNDAYDDKMWIMRVTPNQIT